MNCPPEGRIAESSNIAYMFHLFVWGYGDWVSIVQVDCERASYVQGPQNRDGYLTVQTCLIT
jgi:hypothetical protein